VHAIFSGTETQSSMKPQKRYSRRSVFLSYVY